mmetsp:Transcript_56858/g.169720  ORF Transcript_56858/g.169720 Transcript_56858/m.169720 type:complete len:335 (-) Transcript_56858:74-1078(-)
MDKSDSESEELSPPPPPPPSTPKTTALAIFFAEALLSATPVAKTSRNDPAASALLPRPALLRLPRLARLPRRRPPGLPGGLSGFERRPPRWRLRTSGGEGALSISPQFPAPAAAVPAPPKYPAAAPSACIRIRRNLGSIVLNSASSSDSLGVMTDVVTLRGSSSEWAISYDASGSSLTRSAEEGGVSRGEWGSGCGGTSAGELWLARSCCGEAGADGQCDTGRDDPPPPDRPGLLYTAYSSLSRNLSSPPQTTSLSNKRSDDCMVHISTLRASFQCGPQSSTQHRMQPNSSGDFIAGKIDKLNTPDKAMMPAASGMVMLRQHHASFPLPTLSSG